jgi:hypothetical protein
LEEGYGKNSEHNQQEDQEQNHLAGSNDAPIIQKVEACLSDWLSRIHQYIFEVRALNTKFSPQASEKSGGNSVPENILPI